MERITYSPVSSFRREGESVNFTCVGINKSSSVPLDYYVRMHLQNLLPAKACIIRSQPSIPMPPHFPVAAAGTMHAGSPNRVGGVTEGTVTRRAAQHASGRYNKIILCTPRVNEEG